MKIMYLKIAAKLLDANMNQKDLAKQMHMTTSALNRRMTGRVEWGVSDIKQLCKIFGCTFEELFGE